MPSYIEFDLAMLESSHTPSSGATRRVTLAGKVEGKGRWVRQTCSGDNFGGVEIQLEPYHGQRQFQLVWQVTEEQIPEEFLPGVVEGIRQAALQERPGSVQLTNLRITVVGGAYHPVDSSQRAFARATLKAFEDALAKTELVPAE